MPMYLFKNRAVSRHAESPEHSANQQLFRADQPHADRNLRYVETQATVVGRENDVQINMAYCAEGIFNRVGQ
jgi:hypothetical protein